MKLTLEQAADLACWAEIVATHAKNYQGMLTFSQSPEAFHEDMVNSLRKPLENLLKSLPVELLAEINGNAQIERTESPQVDTERRPAPQDFVVFNDVARVLGHEEAEKHLQLVLNKKIHARFDASRLDEAFLWGTSPQGWDCWFDISVEIEKLKE